ncbi:hypothetical protein CBR_g36595 [Chara braunii]|uniref:Reverse transcriptase domain-containing protein n=1 Tax=Chara braunii TaxID=69332 RepID=A0A388JZ86_CHABU|nr:hypothetical protein CBR_g36595 [Chara braunii]|eukprot:GBG63108.1 hypothetical protein CBR_g36595 [Chara braunii]
MFRIWQERQDPGTRVEEIVGENEEVTQRLKAGTIKEEPIVVESDDEAQEAARESASTIVERMEDLLAKVGRYQERLRVMCGEAREWEMNLPEVMLYGSGPESPSGPQGCPSVATTGAGPRSGMTFRPPMSHGRAPQAAQTKGQSKATPSQGPSQAPSRAPPRKEPEPERRKEVVEVGEEEDEGDDEEDERLRQEEDRRAEQRAKKRGAQGGAEPSPHDGVPKRKKYAVRLEEGFDVERMVDKLMEGHNDLMNLKDILASAPRLRGELKGRLSRRHEGTMILALSDPACGNYEIIKCRNTGPRSGRNRLNLGSFTFEESEYLRRRLREEQEEEGVGEVLSLSLNDVNKAMEVVAAHDMADPEAIKALREQDLQRLNAVTVRDAGGLPNADALSESCAGRPIISLIDLYSGYDQFPVYPLDRPVTAMHTPRGLIHMNVAPQGWTNAVAMVQRHMIRAMQTVSPHITQPYIDDLVVKGPKEKEENEVMPGVRRFVWKHVQDIDQVLGLLEEHNLTASSPKSKHCMREATILGFVCNEKGWRPDGKKTNKILEWPVPFQSITNVRSFLGTCGFWRSFVKDFATKTEHFRKLVRRDQEWIWGEHQEKAVERMKIEFKEGGLVLGAPNYEATEEKPFVVETDAGPTALGGGVAVEVPRQAEPMEEAPLDAVEKGSGAQESLMAMSTERKGSCLHKLATAMGIGTPQEGPQGLDAPEHAPRLGELRAELGSWATGTDSGGPDSRRQQRQEVMSEPAAMRGSQPTRVCRDEAAMTESAHEEGPRELDTPERGPGSAAARGGEGAEAIGPGPQGHVGLPSCHEVATETIGTPSASSSQGGKKKTARWHDTSCFWCKEGGYRAVNCPELLEDKAEGRVAEVDGKFYDRQGRIVERAPDGGRAQLYRQNQEELCK